MTGRRASVAIEAFEDGFVEVNGVRLHVVAAGPRDGRLVVLLHGFPEFWWSWRHQLADLAGQGFRVLAPDMRGYAQSSKPAGVEAYRVEHLARDVAELIEREGRASAHVAGHDWGAMVAWELAMRHPERVDRLAILNVPHPLRMLTGLLRRAQLRRSWYIFFFQLPRVPERALAARDFARLREVFRADGFDEDEIDAYVDAFRYPGALTGALSYYRAAVRDVLTLRARPLRPVRAEVLVLWGRRDRVLGSELATPHRFLVPRARVELVDASHWLQHDAPELVSERLARFFSG